LKTSEAIRSLTPAADTGAGLNEICWRYDHEFFRDNFWRITFALVAGGAILG